MPEFDWSNDQFRKSFEEDLAVHRKIKKDWNIFKKIKWFSGVIGFQAFLIVCFYGVICYTIVNDARNEKIEIEAQMKAVCFIQIIISVFTSVCPFFIEWIHLLVHLPHFSFSLHY